MSIKMAVLGSSNRNPESQATAVPVQSLQILRT